LPGFLFAAKKINRVWIANAQGIDKYISGYTQESGFTPFRCAPVTFQPPIFDVDEQINVFERIMNQHFQGIEG
jgi:hypothetical protein